MLVTRQLMVPTGFIDGSFMGWWFPMNSYVNCTKNVWLLVYSILMEVNGYHQLF